MNIVNLILSLIKVIVPLVMKAVTVLDAHVSMAVVNCA